MNVEIGTEVAQFPEKEYINGIFVAVWLPMAGKTCQFIFTPSLENLQRLATLHSEFYIIQKSASSLK